MGTVTLSLKPVNDTFVLKNRIYESLKSAIIDLNIYQDHDEHRLDERQLSEDLGVSRTPIREALCRLENEGFVHTIPRRGAFVARKSKREILDMITVWAALEGMAARLATSCAGDNEIAALRKMLTSFSGGEVESHIDEYSEANISFHQALLAMGKCQLIIDMTANLFLHIRSIRMRTISEDHRASRSIIDHMHIVEALEARAPDLAERLTREHNMNLAAHVEKNVHWLD